MSGLKRKAATGTLTRKRKAPRKFKTPRCSVQRCNKRAEIAGLCVSHAERRADTLYRKLCREKDGRCVLENIWFDCWGPLQGAHVYRVRHRALRWSMNPRNCYGLCARHHQRVDNDQAAWVSFGVWVWTDADRALAHELAMADADRRASIEAVLAWLDPEGGDR